MINDADLEMLELAELADMATDGVCGICEEALYPLDPKWNGTYTNPRYTQEMAAECVGPVDSHQPYHVRCLEDQQ